MKNENEKQYYGDSTKFMSLVTYACPNDVRLVIEKHCSQVLHANYRIHDKDDAVPHIHCNIWLKKSRRCDVVENWFSHCMDENNNYVNTFADYTKDCRLAFEYLTHKNDPDKYQYDDDGIVYFGLSIDEYLKQKTIFNIKDNVRRRAYQSVERSVSLIDDLLDGASTMQMIKTYGRDYIINRKRYLSAAAAVAYEAGDFETAKLFANYADDRPIVEYAVHCEYVAENNGIDLNNIKEVYRYDDYEEV